MSDLDRLDRLYALCTCYLLLICDYAQGVVCQIALRGM